MGGSSKAVTSGYRYYMGLHFGICHGPVDALQEIRAGDRVAWQGNQTANGEISINAGQLFGGDEREGGIAGNADVLMGGSAQAQNAYLQSQLGTDIPAYRGILSLVYKVQRGTLKAVLTWAAIASGQISANNPYIKPWAFKVKRILQGWNSDVWYSGKAVIGADMNPAHIIYQCLTDPVWGMGYPIQQIDDTSFTAAADTLYSEGFGLSMIWNQQAKIGDFIGEVLNHIGAVLYVDPSSGKFAMKLIRGGYTVGSLPLFDETNGCRLEHFQRAGYGETVNEVVVVFKDRAKDMKDSTCAVQDLANVQAQGAVVSQTKQYPGITSASIAARVAMRDLVSASTPLSKIRLKVNRYAWSLIPGDVFRFTWPKLGLSQIVYRVLAVDYGTLEDGEITVEAAEDVFGLPSNVYVAQQASQFTEQSSAPTAITVQEAVELPYYEIVRSLSSGDLAAMDQTDGAYMGAIAGRPGSTIALNFRTWSKVGAASYEQRELGEFTPWTTCTASIAPAVTSTIPIAAGTDLSQVGVGTLAKIGNGATGEWVEVTAIDLNAQTVTVARGALDTVPKAWANGTRIWFIGAFIGLDNTERATGETVDFKLTTISTGGELDITSGSITAVSATAAQRFARPYPPGNVKVNGSAYPTTIAGAATITWAHRDRTMQTAGVIHQDAASIGPEADTTYTLRLYGETNTLLRTVTGLTGTSYAFADELAISGLGSLGAVTTLASEDAEAALSGWTAETDSSLATRWITPLYWDGTYFVAYESEASGSRQVWRSTDADTWSKLASAIMPASGPYAYGGGYYLANGGAQYSTDLVSWTGSSTAAGVKALMWDGSQFVRITVDGEIQTSATGASWTTQATLSSFVTWGAGSSFQLTKCGSLYYLVHNPAPSTLNPPALFTSSALTSWTSRASTVLSSWKSAGAVTTNGSGTYVIAGVTSAAGNAAKIAKSTDGTTFAEVTAPAITTFGPVHQAYDGGEFWIIYSLDTAGAYQAAVSSDGSTWAKKVVGTDFTLSGAAVAPTYYRIKSFVSNGSGTRAYQVEHDFVTDLGGGSTSTTGYDRIYRSTDKYTLTLKAPAGASTTRDTSVYAQGAASLLEADPWGLTLGAWKSFANIVAWNLTSITAEVFLRGAIGEAPELAFGNYTGSTPLVNNPAYSLALNLAGGKIQFKNGGAEVTSVSYALAADTWYKLKAVVTNNTSVSLYLYAADGTTLLGSTTGVSIGGSKPASTGSYSFLWAKKPGRYDSASVSGGLWTARLNNSLRFELEAVRGGLTSWQAHDITVSR